MGWGAGSLPVMDLILKVGKRREAPRRPPRDLGRLFYTTQGGIGISHAPLFYELVRLRECHLDDVLVVQAAGCRGLV